MTTLALTLALLAAQAVPVPEATVTLGNPPLFAADSGAEDVVFSPDGSQLAAVVKNGKGRTVAIYSVTTGQVLRRIGQLPAKLTARVAWSPRADRIVTAVQGIVQVWHARSGKKLKHLDLGKVFRVQVERLLVSDRAEFAVYIPRRGMSSATVDLKADRLVVEAIPYRKEIKGFDAMGRLLVTDHEAARLIDPLSSRPLQTCKAARTTGGADAYTGTQLWLRGEVWMRQLNNLARCKPSKWQPLRPGNAWRQAVVGLRGGVIAAANNKTIAVWDRNGAELYRYTHHKPVLNYANRLHVSPDGTHVAFPGRRLRVLRMTDKRWLSLPNDVDDPEQVTMSGDGRIIAVADHMLGTRVFQRSNGALVAALGPASRLVTGKHGEAVVTLYKGRVSKVDVASGQVLWDMPTKATFMAISADRSTVALAGEVVDKRYGVKVFDWVRGPGVSNLRQHLLESGKGWTSSVALNRNGSQVMTTMGTTHDLFVMDVTSSSIAVAHQHNFKSRGGLSRGLFIPGDTKLVTTPAFSKRADVVNMGTGSTRQLKTGRHYTSAAVALPDGKRVVLADEGGSIGIYDIGRTKPLVRWDAHNMSVRSIAASSDGRWLVSTSKDGRVKVWPLAGRISAVTAQR